MPRKAVNAKLRAADTPLARQKKYEAQVSEAIARGHFWKMVWAELARDYNAAVANVIFLWRQVDTHFAAK